jgi:hypothetical protein
MCVSDLTQKKLDIYIETFVNGIRSVSVSLCLLKAASGDAAGFRAADCSWTGIKTIGFTVADPVEMPNIVKLWM